jgi:hypothetical protein
LFVEKWANILAKQTPNVPTKDATLPPPGAGVKASTSLI